jgi:hypothetical protein
MAATVQINVMLSLMHVANSDGLHGWHESMHVPHSRTQPGTLVMDSWLR